MPWKYLLLISILSSFLFYISDSMNKMAHDIKYIRSRMSK